MSIEYYRENTLADHPARAAAVQALIDRCSDEFVPPLSQRSSTTQSALTPESACSPSDAYYRDMLGQRFLLVVEDDCVEGFLSYRVHYHCQELQSEYEDPKTFTYVSTIIVDPEHRGKGITKRLYLELMEARQGPNAPWDKQEEPDPFVATRTWSQNSAHIHLLRKLGFDLTLLLPNDRGQDIDTVYFRRPLDDPDTRKALRLSLWEKCKAYKLDTSIYAIGAMGICTAVFLWVYLSPRFADHEFAPELALAIATSLLASIFCMAADMYINYRARKNDQLLEGLHAFGIRNLHFNKQALLLELLQDCTSELWITGCRLILTRKIASYIAERMRRFPDLRVRVLLCPPWSTAYQLVYGRDEDTGEANNIRVIDNYFSVLRALEAACGPDTARCQVHLTDKPVFNDTYKVDKCLVTGPYLHCKSTIGTTRITANDFFTYDVIRRSQLQKLMESEYATLWDESVEVLDWARFHEACTHYDQSMTDEAKIALLRDACVPIQAEPSLLAQVTAEYEDL